MMPSMAAKPADVPAAWAAAPPRAVIFDLDGTLTRPLLDFDAIRAEIGLRPRLPILEQLAAGDDALRARAEPILRRHENDAIDRATLSDGCAELLRRLDERRVPTAILTRNTRDAVAAFVHKFALSFRAIYTREDGPPKPSPAGVLALCDRMGAIVAHTVAVGDYKFDVQAGRAAGCRTVLLAETAPDDLDEWGSPDLVVPSLRALLSLWG